MRPSWLCPRAWIALLVVASYDFPRPADVPDPDGAVTPTPTYQLLSVEPAIATAGDSIMLEGTFAASATVQFPGGVTQAANVLGEHRATVVVPMTASAGDLTVTTGGVTVGPLRFRRASFGLGLQPFRSRYEQVDSARQSPVLQVARSSATTVVLGRWLYVIGGDDGSGATNSVERASVNADGTLSAFSIVTDTGLAEARWGHTAITIDNSLFVIGGTSSRGILDSIERSSINSDGTLGSFSRLDDAKLAIARSGHVSMIIGNAVYVVGGTGKDGLKLGSIERAAVLPSGALSSFEIVSSTELVAPRADHAMELIGSALYVIGGELANGAPAASVERAVIRPDGSLEEFRTVAQAKLAEPRSGHRTIALGEGLYVLGGKNATGVVGDIERAPISSDGVVGSFSSVLGISLTRARARYGLATIENYLYVIGGSDSNGPRCEIERASVKADSALGSFSRSSATLVQARDHHTTTAIGDFIYVIGHATGANTIERAFVSTDGAINSFATVANLSLNTSRNQHTTAIVRNSIFVIGGGGDGRFSSVERATINTDGEIGSFGIVSSSLNESRIGHASVVLGNFLYVIGGFGGSVPGRLTSIERATINADGTLGPFSIVPGVALNTGRNFFSVITTDHYLYVIGGLVGSDGTGEVERATIGADGSIGPFSPTSGLLYGRGAHASAVVGNALYVFGGLSAEGHRGIVERAIINADGTLSEFSAIFDVMVVDARARHTVATMDNALYLIGGEAELPSGQVVALPALERADLR
jgi:N-acetylneuraminic acid mutarotase